MKIQSLAVIFIIIIIPVILATSIYTNIQIDTITLQSSYDTKLYNATYDAIKAFQLNETNSNTQDISTEKIRDIEASIETFYNSLAVSLNLDGYGSEELSSYVPALAYTLYDGYYIYSAFNNISTGKFERGLKPFIYYSARYRKGGIDVTVNYTLDNYVTIYGNVPGEGYITKSGYLINPDDVTGDNGNSLYYKGQLIQSEVLKEVNALSYEESRATNPVQEPKEVQYIYKLTENNQRNKYYTEDNGNSWYRLSIDRRKIPIVRDTDKPASAKDNSAYLYYKEAQIFSQWVKNNLSTLELKDAVNYNGLDDADKNIYYISTAMETDKIFDLSGSIHDPENSKSSFNEHRRNVIKYTIQTNLNAAIAGYNQISQVNASVYNFKMPVLSEIDWDNILNNVSLISFMQGFPIKGDYYNGYSIVTNNKNREFVDPGFIYFIDADYVPYTSDPSIPAYHTIYDETALNGIGNVIGYRNLDFDRMKTEQTTIVTPAGGVDPHPDTGSNTEYYYQHHRTSCYDCIITTSSRNSSDNTFNSSTGTEKSLSEYLDYLTNNGTTQNKIAQAYYTAIARERYSSYKSNVLY